MGDGAPPMSDEQRTEREARGQCPDADCIACRFGRLWEEMLAGEAPERALYASMLAAASRALIESVRREGA